MASYRPPLSRADKVISSDSSFGTTTGNIAAIEIGTTSISLAYAIGGDRDIRTLDLDQDAARPLNMLMFKEKEEQGTLVIKEFGERAKATFLAMDSNERSKHILVEQISFPMEAIHRDTQVELSTGKQCYLMEVFAFILKYLRDQLMEHLSRTKTPLKTTDFDWVITVPAIWDAGGKRMMKEAAYMAGLTNPSDSITKFTQSHSLLRIPNKANPEKLNVIVKEESIAVYCQEMSSHHPPPQYMVIDIGGSNIEIVQAQCSSDGLSVENIHVPTAKTCGGRQVNEAFSKLLQEIVSNPGFSKLLDSKHRSQNQAGLNKLINKEFEEHKVSFGDCKSEEIAVTLPGKFTKFYDKTLKEGAERMDGVKYNSDILYISKAVVESKLFGPASDGIISCIQSAIEKNGYTTDIFYLVGGFGGCKYVHQKVTAAIERMYQSKGRHCRVILPPSPHLAATHGAVVCRRDPGKIKARLADATYGIVIATPFNREKHDEHYKYYDEEIQQHWCGDVFNVFVERGEALQPGEVYTTSLSPVRQSQTQMPIAIYSTPNTGVQYAKDKSGQPTVTKIGQMIVQVPNPDNLPKEDRKIDITMDFCGTEIIAKAKYRVTGEEVTTVCDFLSAN